MDSQTSAKGDIEKKEENKGDIRMDNKKYNGWANRETWLVNLHFNPETVGDIENIKNDIEEIEDRIENFFLRDYIDFGLIDWRELEEAMGVEE